ncbi:LysM peptidoglycan-binding domain-containing protein [bacterium]|nr:LysM peptidoglycan-binding domain-containing protein [bacterium]
MESFKKVFVIIATTGILVACFTGTGIAEDQTWTYDGVDYRIPQPVQEIQLPADIPESHTVVSGDCLWAISKSYLSDPYLWPLVWEENLDFISNPHLIHPGDIVKLPGGTIVATDDNIAGQPTKPFKSDSESGEEIGDTPAGATGNKPEPSAFSVTSESNIIASGFISRDKVVGPEIIAAETTSYDLSVSDILFIEGGPAEGLQIDAPYFVLREKRIVKHPISRRNLGRLYHVMGEVRMVCVNESISSCVITKSYHSILRGDILIPRTEIPIPLTFGAPVIERCNPSSKKLPGTIIDSFDGEVGVSDAVIIAEGDIAYIDLGSRDGVAPGDYFTIFKRDMDDPRLPKFVSGDAMVLKVQEETSVIVVTMSRTAVFLGAQIELRQ